MNDPFGEAIKDFYLNGEAVPLTINNTYTEDEEIEVSYLFRDENMMPGLEKRALSSCRGKILDVGAAAGCHSIILQERGFQVTALERSKNAVDIMRKRGLKHVKCEDIYCYTGEKYDTILLLMNGAGIGKTLNGLKDLLQHLKKLLSNEGQILMDSSDIKYLFEEEDGSFWIDLNNTNYYGEMEYEVIYKKTKTTFQWLFVDFETLRQLADETGLHCELVLEGDHYNYLARLKL